MPGNSAMGIIFPNMHDQTLPELTALRTMASVPFAARYRLIDFALSAMVGAGVTNIGVIVKQNYQSLLNHLGNGRESDLSRKRGGLTVFPPYSDAGATVYHGRIGALKQVADFIANSPEEYVILMDGDVVCLPNFNEILDRHIANGADITMVYEKTDMPPAANAVTFEIDESDNITAVRMGSTRQGQGNVSMNICILRRTHLLELIGDAVSLGHNVFERDIIAANIGKLKVQGYLCTGYRSRICSLASYYKANMALLNPANMAALFKKELPVYTKVHDEAPVRYKVGGSANNSALADGCVIEGTVRGSVLFRGVKVGKGALVENCVLMQGTVVEPGVNINCCITDKNVVITANKNFCGDAAYPMYIAKGVVV